MLIQVPLAPFPVNISRDFRIYILAFKIAQFGAHSFATFRLASPRNEGITYLCLPLGEKLGLEGDRKSIKLRLMLIDVNRTGLATRARDGNSPTIDRIVNSKPWRREIAPARPDAELTRREGETQALKKKKTCERQKKEGTLSVCVVYFVHHQPTRHPTFVPRARKQPFTVFSLRTLELLFIVIRLDIAMELHTLLSLLLT